MKRLAMILALVLATTPLTAGQSKPAAAVLPKAYEQYMAMMLDGKKIGYEKTTRTVTDTQVRTLSETNLTIRRGNFAISMQMAISSTETVDGKPLAFGTSEALGAMRQSVTGEVQNGTMTVTKEVGGKARQERKPWPDGALLPWGAERAMRMKGLEPGTKYELTMFSPNTQNTIVAATTVGTAREVDVFGRVVTLTQIDQVARVGKTTVPSSMFVDDSWRALKQTANMLGMELTAIACDEAFAKSPTESVGDFLAKVSVSAPAGAGDPRKASKAVYTIQPLKAGDELSFLDFAGQSCKKVDAGYEVTVAKPSVPAGATYPYKGDDKELLADIKPSEYLQSDARVIRDLTTRALGKTPPADAAEAAGKITAFVRSYIRQKDLSVGYASAVEVAQSRQGDCTEHAVLTAAMLRSAGIPARVVVGVAYVDQWLGHSNVFLPHAWTAARIGDAWIPLDAALGQFDSGHIAMASGNGDLTSYLDMVSTLGNFRIETIEAPKK